VTSDADVMTERLRMFGVPTDRILTFPMGVDTDQFSPTDEPPREGPRIVSNRKLEAVYGVESIIDAFPGILEALPGAALTIAGEGELAPVLRARARNSLAGGAVVFVGDVDHDRMPILLRENHIYVSMSHSDTTSVSLLEAMACGLFPIVSDLPANREWIVDGENGRLVPPRKPMHLARAIVDAWGKPDLIASAREHNLRVVRERASWEDNMRAVGELFDRLASGHDS
jgi:glycosyltransferase involved in cell wall biosynthesis